MSGIQEKVVAITGASSDIGEAAAKLLAGRGAKVMLGALRISGLNALAREIVDAGGSAHYQALDVTQPKSMQCFIDEATEVFGRVDVIVNNAGVMPLSMLEAFEVEERDRMLDLNMHGVLHGIAAGLPRMRAQGGGQFINLSVGGDIRVAVVSPGVSDSELVDGISDPEARGRMWADRQVAITADAIARAIASAIEQSADVDSDGRVRCCPYETAV